MASNKPDRYNVVLFSKTGCGKSALANALTGTSEFPVSENGMISKTKKCKYVVRSAEDISLTVVDTPGSMDTRKPQKALLELTTAITMCPDGFHAVLLVLRIDVRFTTEEEMAVELLAMVFGQDIFKFCIVVFSHGDHIDNDEQTFKTQIEKARKKVHYLDDLLTKCDNRAVLVHNGGKSDSGVQEQQIERLINMICVMSQRHQNSFTNKYFDLARDFMKLEIAKVREKEQQMREPNADRQLIASQGDTGNMETEDFTEARSAAARGTAAVMKNDGKSCFPADAVVQTPSGQVTMSQLSVGQSVLCMQNGSLTYSPVYMWGHRDEASWSNSYVTVRSDSAQLTLSSDHLLLIIDEMGDEVAVPAGNVCAGHTVQVLRHLMPDSSFGVKRETVLTVERCVMRSGLFAPFTMCGNIIVDGVLASCYIRQVSHALSHGLLWPVRFAWQVAPQAVGAWNQLGDDGMPGWVSFLANGILPRLGWLRLGVGQRP